jgi:hypothetical protein
VTRRPTMGDAIVDLVRRRGPEGLAEVAEALDGGDAVPGPAVAVARSLGAPSPPEAHAWADACEGALTGAGGAKSGTGAGPLGTHATPWPWAVWLASSVAAPPGASVLDPACGVGHLLVAEAVRQPRPAGRWLGWDVCPGRAAATRVALWLAHERRGKPCDYAGVRALDALRDRPEARAGAVLANPPFASVRELVRRLGAGYFAALRAATPELRGSFDLYVPFVLRLGDWLTEDARFGVILPATYWSAGYAAPARRALAPHLTAVHRLSGRDVFARAAVTAHVLFGRAAASERTALFRSELVGGTVVSGPEGCLPPAALVDTGYPEAALGPRGPCVALGEVADVTAGTPGYQAGLIAAALRESGEAGLGVGHEARAGEGERVDGAGEEARSGEKGSVDGAAAAQPGAGEGESVDGAGEGEGAALPFVVTRSIDAYRLLPGPVRFQRRRWQSPELRVSVLTPGKRALFAGQKIVVAGISRRLEAARDARGVALGVGVYAVVPRGVSTEVILALLNSAAISEWYRRRFLGRELSGGYFAVNASHLAQVPVPVAWLEGEPAAERVAALVLERETCEDPDRSTALDAQLDALVSAALATPAGCGR